MLEEAIASIRNSAREFAEVERLFSPEYESSRKLVFYSEGAFYYRYYQDYIEYILSHSDIDICYISSDVQDPVFSSTEKRIKPFYIKNALAATFARLDCKSLVMTAPDLNNCAIKRAKPGVRHIYAFHGISSIHQQYRLGAFDHYDSILCIDDQQIEELRKSETVYGTKSKELILTGYPFVERIQREHLEYDKHANGSSDPLCLIAPTWAPLQKQSSLLENCIIELLQALSKTRFRVLLRPHIEFVKRNPAKMREIERLIGKRKNTTLQTQLSSLQILHEADLLVTDHSSIAFDFAFGTERPVLFIDTPTRIDNPEIDRLGIEPIENSYRSQIGTCLAASDVEQVGAKLESLLASQADFRSKVPSMRDAVIANWQRAAEIGGKYILDSLN